MRKKLTKVRFALLSFCLVFGLINYSHAQQAEAPLTPHNCAAASCPSMQFAKAKTPLEAFEQQLKVTLIQQLDDMNAKRGLGLCFAPDTDAKYLDELLKAQSSNAQDFRTGLTPNEGGTTGNFQLQGSIWDETATDGPGLPQGDCRTLTWSIVPDGTPLSAWGNIPAESNDPSDFISWLDGIYGCVSNPADLTASCWFPLIQGVFDAWGEESGLQYVYVTDDGAPMSNAGPPPFMPEGALGVRGDLRVCGHFIDGNSNVLAYNFFPGPFNFGDGIAAYAGDMFLDTGDNFYNNTTMNSLGLRNVLTHEHGHGLGLSHSCPIEQTKLMEPFVSFMFDGVQEDDRLGAQRLYGDRLCDVTTTTGDHTGTGFSVEGVSIDDETEVDEYSAVLAAGVEVSIVLTPVGTEYLAGPQDGSPNPGGCNAGTLFDALTQANLDVELLDPANAVVATGAANPAGVAEMITFNTTTAGTYTIRIRSTGTADVIQAYEMTCNSVVVLTAPVPSITASCECDNPNVVIAGGAVTHFQNTLSVMGTPGDMITLTTGDANFLDATLTQIPNGTVLGTIPAGGTLTFEFFQAAGTGGAITLSDNDATANPLQLPVCDADACKPSPDDFNIGDPCSCSDPLNRLDPDTDLPTHFHDVLTVAGTAGAQVVLVTGGPNFLNAGLAQIPNGTILGTVPLSYDFYHADGASGSIVVSVGGINADPFAISVCNAAGCAQAPIPTMGEWALMIFGLLILNLSVFFLRRKEDIFA